MKSVLRSVKPYWFYLICEDKKKIEVCKTEPLSKEWDGIVYLYCSKDMRSFKRIPEQYREKYKKYLGTVGARFYCFGIMDISSDYVPLGSCLTSEELVEYGKGKPLYGLHISNLKIYDKPRALSEFKKPEEWCHMVVKRDGHLTFYDGYGSGKPLTRAPQSWQYVEEVEVIEKAGRWQGYVTDKLPIIKCYDVVFHKLVKGENPDER